LSRLYLYSYPIQFTEKGVKIFWKSHALIILLIIYINLIDQWKVYPIFIYGSQFCLQENYRSRTLEEERERERERENGGISNKDVYTQLHQIIWLEMHELKKSNLLYHIISFWNQFNNLVKLPAIRGRECFLSAKSWKCQQILLYHIQTGILRSTE
jgi:hypothetical protein